MGLSSIMNISENAIEKIIDEYIPKESDIQAHVKGIKVIFISRKLEKEWSWIVPLPDFPVLDDDFKNKLIEGCIKPALNKILN